MIINMCNYNTLLNNAKSFYEYGMKEENIKEKLNQIEKIEKIQDYKKFVNDMIIQLQTDLEKTNIYLEFAKIINQKSAEFNNYYKIATPSDIYRIYIGKMVELRNNLIVTDTNNFEELKRIYNEKLTELRATFNKMISNEKVKTLIDEKRIELKQSVAKCQKLNKINIDDYFKNSQRINPCVARMGLQEAQTDALISIEADLKLGKITPQKYWKLKNVIKTAIFKLNHDRRLSDLEHRIRDFEIDGKKIYESSWKKRLAIIPGILDCEYAGEKQLSAVQEAKIIKRLNYFLRRIFSK